uniref:Uncharacterized protein n=1 Tax=Plectus sambesii TaxID=2011161 RepID=A0A914VHB9_9BILA
MFKIGRYWRKFHRGLEEMRDSGVLEPWYVHYDLSTIFSQGQLSDARSIDRNDGDDDVFLRSAQYFPSSGHQREAATGAMGRARRRQTNSSTRAPERCEIRARGVAADY